jgi:hypothetical protein
LRWYERFLLHTHGVSKKKKKKKKIYKTYKTDMCFSYRKIAASSCEGGKELEKIGAEQMWCPGASRSGHGWLGFIFAPILGAGLVFGALQYRKRGGFG